MTSTGGPESSERVLRTLIRATVPLIAVVGAIVFVFAGQQVTAAALVGIATGYIIAGGIQ